MKSSKSLNFSAGSILWLPAKDQIANEHLDDAGTIDDGCFDHPVLILAVKPGKKEVIILMITSFGGKDLLERHPRNALTRSQHLPIYPSKIHPDNGSQLFLVNNSGLHRSSYIKTEVQRTIRTVLLRPTRHSTCTLRADSYDYLIKAIGFTPPPPPKIHIRGCSPTPNVLPVSATRSKIAHSTPVHYTRPEPVHYVYPTSTYSTQPVSTRSTNSSLTPNHYTNSIPAGYTHPAPAYSTQYAPTSSTNYTPTPKHYTHSISAGCTHPAPTHSTNFNNRSSHVHWQTERTPLLPTVYNRTQLYSEEPSDCSGVTHMILFIVVAAFAAWTVWKVAGWG